MFIPAFIHDVSHGTHNAWIYISVIARMKFVPSARNFFFARVWNCRARRRGQRDRNYAQSFLQKLSRDFVSADNAGRLSINSEKKLSYNSNRINEINWHERFEMGKTLERSTWWRGKATIARFPFPAVSALFFTITTWRWTAFTWFPFFPPFSLFLFLFFFFSNSSHFSICAVLKANTHRRRRSGITRLKTVVYLANLLTSFGFDSFPLLATFVSILQRAV